MRKISLIIGIIVTIVIVASCMSPIPMTMPPPPPDMPKPAPIPDEQKIMKKKMCVGHDCRSMGAVDSGGTTRGHSDEKND